ncbi:MAG TPA: hypothetical protein VGX28_12065 [Frankiaceae bacterium]|jgi:hypothetical protein|nr:hypothetical protein [Frankiaceae bacterium]
MVPALGVVVLIALSLALEHHGDRVSREHLEAWAAQEGYTLLDVRRRYATFRFFFRSKAQRVYELTAVHDATHAHRSGAAKVGGYFLGAMTPDVDVEWDD